MTKNKSFCITFFAFYLMLLTPVLSANPIKVGIIGDFGSGDKDAQDVANLVKSWSPDFIITTGDNNYPNGAADTIDQNIGAFYADYIFPYQGKVKRAADAPKINRFWPCLGNHDFHKTQISEYKFSFDPSPYFNYFPALKNQYYYDFQEGDVHFFALCSDPHGPDGITHDSTQINWFKKTLSDSKARWKVVYFHHPPYSSKILSPAAGKWPDEIIEKNAERTISLKGIEDIDAVFTGHAHLYERFNINGVPYVINGLGGDESNYKFIESPGPSSCARVEAKYGAMLLEADYNTLSFKFIDVNHQIHDSYKTSKED